MIRPIEYAFHPNSSITCSVPMFSSCFLFSFSAGSTINRLSLEGLLSFNCNDVHQRLTNKPPSPPYFPTWTPKSPRWKLKLGQSPQPQAGYDAGAAHRKDSPRIDDFDPKPSDSLWAYCSANKRAIPARLVQRLYEMLADKKQKPSGGWDASATAHSCRLA